MKTTGQWLSFFNKMMVAGSKAWIVSLDLSAEENVSASQIQALFETLEKENRCQVFCVAASHHFFLSFAQGQKDDIQAILIKIQFDLNLHNIAKLYQIFHLPEDGEKVKSLAYTLGTKNTSGSFKDKLIKTPLNPVFQTNFEIPFTPTLLSHLEKTLCQADLSALMRRQAICAIVGQAQPIELFEEIYVALADLKKALCPSVNIYDSPWLLDRLMETLDKRVLENVAMHDAGSFKKNFSLNIAVKTILSPEFAQFNENTEDSAKQSILLEIKQSDIFNNISSFLAARSFVEAQGYRVCVDTVTMDSLQFLALDKFQDCFVKIIWNVDMLDDAKNKGFLQTLEKLNPAHVILCRIDDKRAIEWGQRQGISLYQGYCIQKMLYQTPRPRTNNRFQGKLKKDP